MKKKIVFLMVLLLFFINCKPKHDEIEKTIENGIEVVLNKIEPYKTNGISLTLQLEFVFSIDTEKEECLEMGLIGIETFDVDSEGNIYLIQWQSKENYIYKFDHQGTFIKSFLRYGQGPGEIVWGGTVLVNPLSEIYAKDPSKRKFLIYSKDGEFLREVIIGRHLHPIPLKNGKYFIFWQDQNPEFFTDYIAVSDAEFDQVTELGVLRWANPSNNKREVNGSRMIHGFSKDEIFVGHSKRGYEIHVYDLEGTLIRKIRKKFTPVDVSDEYKEAFYKSFPEGYPYRANYYFTKSWPPFRYLFTDDMGRLYVMTYEEGSRSGEYIYDIFNPDGVFISRMSLDNLEHNRPITAKAKNNRLYYLHIKKSGYKELVVCRMHWVE